MGPSRIISNLEGAKGKKEKTNKLTGILSLGITSS